MTTSAAAEHAATCGFPGCTRSVRQKDSPDGGGQPPKYCDLINQTTGKYAHNALTSARERARRAKQTGRRDDTGDDTASSEHPASAAQSRAASLLEQWRAELSRASATLEQGLVALSEASDPTSVSAEIHAAERERQRVQLEADEAVTAAHGERDRAHAEADRLREELADAISARDEAMTELDTAESARAEITAEGDRLRRELQELTADRDTQQDRAEQVERDLANAREELQTLTADRDQQHQRAEHAEQHATQAESTATHLREQLDTAESARDAARAQTTEDHAEIARLRAELEAAQAAVTTEQEHAHQRLTDQQTWYDRRIDELRDELDAARTQSQ